MSCIGEGQVGRDKQLGETNKFALSDLTISKHIYQGRNSHVSKFWLKSKEGRIQTRRIQPKGFKSDSIASMQMGERCRKWPCPFIDQGAQSDPPGRSITIEM